MLGWYLFPNTKVGVRDEEHLLGQLGSYLCQDLSQLLQQISLADKQIFHESRTKVTYRKRTCLMVAIVLLNKRRECTFFNCGRSGQLSTRWKME